MSYSLNPIRIISAGLLCLSLCTTLRAQSLFESEPRPWARWDSSDWLAAGAVAGATASSFLVEEEVRAAFQDNRSGVADVLERAGYVYGSPLFTVPSTLLTLGAGELFDDSAVKDTGALMAQLLLSQLLIQQPVRIAVGRARPFNDQGHWSFRPFTRSNDYASFPSGHSWGAFGISNIAARQIDRTWASIGLYALATITALSRMYKDAHWLTDVIVGSFLGYVISTELWKRRQDDDPATFAALRAPSERWLLISIPH